MKKTLTAFAAAVLLLTACENKQEAASTEASTPAADTLSTTAPGETTAPASAAVDSVAVPAGMKKLGEATGDLDKDGKPEAVAVFDTGKENDEHGIGTSRELHIFQLKDGKWALWDKYIGAVMSSETGGVMGDPFQSVEIQNGTIVLKHMGGSRFKWDYTHRFRRQDEDWKLIGTTYVTGTDCEYWETFDYNLSTGSIHYELETEDCSKSTDNPVVAKTTKTFPNKLKALPSLKGFAPGSTSVELKGTKETFHY